MLENLGFTEIDVAGGSTVADYPGSWTVIGTSPFPASEACTQDTITLEVRRMP